MRTWNETKNPNEKKNNTSKSKQTQMYNGIRFIFCMCTQKPKKEGAISIKGFFYLGI